MKGRTKVYEQKVLERINNWGSANKCNSSFQMRAWAHMQRYHQNLHGDKKGVKNGPSFAKKDTT